MSEFLESFEEWIRTKLMTGLFVSELPCGKNPQCLKERMY